MRGTRTIGGMGILKHGIIPAYAGNTTAAAALPLMLEDHPRVCGEHQACGGPTDLSAGSSPRMRGTLRGGKGRARERGIIPAYAGNTGIGEIVIDAVEDHPRVCGEHLKLAECAQVGRGSSPRMRGTPFADGVEHAANGIIPAYAGNTPHWWRNWHGVRDHPRVCGEHVMMVGNFRLSKGSSPRMRGTRR